MEDKEEETMKDRIIKLLRKGYKRAQLIQDFGFAERTVDAAIKAYKELGYGNADDAKGTSGHITDDGASAPPSKSEGKETAGTGGRNGALAIRKEKESILPEWLERDVAEIFDGQIRDQRIFLAGMSVPLMGLRLFAEGVRPIIELMATWQKGQAEAAQAAQQSGIEMAQTAGEAAAGGVGKFFMETKPWLATSPNPMQSMMVDTMRPIFQQIIGQMMGSLIRPSAPGQPRAQPGQGQPSQPAPGQEAGFQPMSDQERKDIFGGEK